ncbi:hypothetical protein R5R35_009402 [Gryllus longicercus]|uniref:Endonuclease-reverse transcriptase n=1 Tax=Gryllus longicercus TaxID=2509291 RepID=A0AAN9VXJ9_9ORTH
MLDGDNRPERRTAVIDRELLRYRVDIAALSETRIAEVGSLIEKNYTFFWKGRDKTHPRQHGVGFAIRNTILKGTTTAPMGVNERIMTLRLGLFKGTPINFISCYAPTLNAEANIKEDFYKNLDTVLNSIPKSESIFLLGDFNARVGQNFEAWNGVIGRHSIGKQNENGEMLLSTCASHNLTITNTLFQLKEIYKGTWKHPRSGHWHALDHIIVRQRDRRTVRVTRAYRGAECDTDHRLLICKVHIEPKKIGTQTTKNKQIRYDVTPLMNSTTRADLVNELQNHIQKRHSGKNNTIEEEWNSLVQGIQTATKKVLKPTTKKTSPDWFNENSQAIEAVIKKKNNLFKLTIIKPQDMQLRADYRKAKALVQQTTRQLKNKWFQDKAQEIQVLADQNNSSAFYKAVNTIYGPTWNGCCPIKNKEGTLLTHSKEISHRWREYYQDLLNTNSIVNQQVIDQIPQYPVCEHLAIHPTTEEITKALAKIKNNKAPGPDGIPIEIYKYGGASLLSCLTEIFQRIWQQGKSPSDFKNALTVNIYKKKGDRADCTNYRGISLLCTAGKILTRVISDRLQPLLERIFPESQAGFRPNRGTIDMIFTLRQIQEKVKEQHSSLYATFVDLRKAFDMVNRHALWKILLKFGCPQKLVNIIADLHEGNEARVITSGGVTDGFIISNGVRQGCVLAPLLFNIFMTAFIISLDRTLQDRGMNIRYRFDKGLYNLARLKAQRNVRNRYLTELQYADDLVILAKSEPEAQRMMDTFASVYKSLGMEINSSKTKSLFMYCSGPTLPQRNGLIIDGTSIELVEQFNYLGSLVTTGGDLDAEISHRIRNASYAFYKLRDRVFNCNDLTIRTKIMVFKAVVLSILLYGSECWTIYKKHVKTLEKFQMRQLRNILGIKWQDFISNQRIRDQTGCITIENILARNQLRWIGHVTRMSEERTPKQILYGELAEGNRRQGGQLKRYKDGIHAMIKNIGIKDTWETLCQDRSKWRNVCYKNKGIFKARQDAGSTANNASFTCSECQRAIASKIGLVSHLRAHERRRQQ